MKALTDSGTSTETEPECGNLNKIKTLVTLTGSPLSAAWGPGQESDQQDVQEASEATDAGMGFPNLSPKAIVTVTPAAALTLSARGFWAS